MLKKKKNMSCLWVTNTTYTSKKRTKNSADLMAQKLGNQESLSRSSGNYWLLPTIFIDPFTKLISSISSHYDHITRTTWNKRKPYAELKLCKIHTKFKSHHKKSISWYHMPILIMIKEFYDQNLKTKGIQNNIRTKKIKMWIGENTKSLQIQCSLHKKYLCQFSSSWNNQSQIRGPKSKVDYIKRKKTHRN